jgi:hypothetical protein
VSRFGWISNTEVAGEMLRVDTPTWEPLLELAPDHIEDFMWMFDVELDGGPLLHAYKHWWTRRYIHLSDDGRAFVFLASSENLEDEGVYRQVCPECQLRLVLAGAERMTLSIPGYTEIYGEGDGLDAG